jgi:hypothetical protein
MPKIIKSIKETENNEKNSNFNLGRNPLEIVYGPLKIGQLLVKIRQNFLILVIRTQKKV